MTDRPDLQRLLEEIRARKIDVIVVYKADRLTPRRVNGVDIDAEEVDLDVAGCLSFSNSTASLPMSTKSQLREKLRKIEALFAGAGTAGERRPPPAPAIKPAFANT
jgi:hypothetical protein